MHQKHVAVLGGSCDPIHIGHLWVAQQVKEQYADVVDNIWLMPTYSSSAWGKKLSPEKDRVNMCSLALYDFCADFLTLSMLEIRLKIEGTWGVIDYLAQRLKNIRFSWIIGSDWKITQFKNYEDLTKKCGFIRINRYNNGDGIELPIGFNLSSSRIRDRVRKNQTICGLVTPSVERYIKKNNLYRETL